MVLVKKRQRPRVRSIFSSPRDNDSDNYHDQTLLPASNHGFSQAHMSGHFSS